MRRELDREVILRALGRLSELLGERGVMGEICLLGGTVMVLAFNARASTRDIDAVVPLVEDIFAQGGRG